MSRAFLHWYGKNIGCLAWACETVPEKRDVSVQVDSLSAAGQKVNNPTADGPLDHAAESIIGRYSQGSPGTGPAAWTSVVNRMQNGRHQYCLYPFDGRLVHEGLATLLAHRLSRQTPSTIMITVNDYGLMLDCNEPLSMDADQLQALLSPEGAKEQLQECLNSTEMAKRQFREIARIAGLVHPGIPGRPEKSRHLQASSNMFFGAFETYDPGNLLLRQARDEVMENQLEWSRLKALLLRLHGATICFMNPKAYTPFAFPLIVDQMRERVSSESLDSRVQKMLDQLNRTAERT